MHFVNFIEYSREMLGFHHLRGRVRQTQNIEPFPARAPSKRALDYVMYVVGVAQPFALVPQVVAVYVDHQTAGLSPLTWSLLAFCNILWALYGLAHRDRIIMIANTLIAIFDLAILVGILHF
jgi:uncharacterized protein with PQ loop repeat